MSSELIIERDELEQKLKTQIMEVSFTKINGDKRVMQCTLSPIVLPPATKKIHLHKKKFVRLTKKL